MKTPYKFAHAVSAVLLVSAALFGCQKPPGPAEQAGRDIDKAVESAGQKIEQAGERVQDAAKNDKK